MGALNYSLIYSASCFFRGLQWVMVFWSSIKQLQSHTQELYQAHFSVFIWLLYGLTIATSGNNHIGKQEIGKWRLALFRFRENFKLLENRGDWKMRTHLSQEQISAIIEKHFSVQGAEVRFMQYQLDDNSFEGVLVDHDIDVELPHSDTH